MHFIRLLCFVFKVKNNNEAEFDHWSDEGITFPKITENDLLVVRYQNTDVLKGTFKLKT